MINIEIKNSIQDEIKRVEYTLGKIDWYRERGYKFKLPESVNENSSSEWIERTISEEYDEQFYENHRKDFHKEWNDFISNVSLDNLPFDLKSKYTIYFTKYGVGGSYDTKNDSVIIKVWEGKEPGMTLRTFIHEIIHISIEHLIEKYNIEHWDKERLVDLLGMKYFPNFTKEQQIYKHKDFSKLEDNFKKNMPDLKKVISLI
jgi:hypothetical protein